MHRFDDPEYAALTLRLRSADTIFDAVETAAALQQHGHVRWVDDLDGARSALVRGYFEHHGRGRSVAIVTATNEEAAYLNDAIQQERVARGQISARRIAMGAEEQRILEGDVVQTRRNDRAAGVENRATWQVARIGPAALELRRIDDAADIRVVSLEYSADYVHLAYATTVHGIQGETTDTSLVGPDVDASGLYVGLTRGRRHNEVVVVAHSDAAAREELANEMMRGLPEPDLSDAVAAAHRDLRRSARDETSVAPGASALRQWMCGARTVLLQADAEDAGSEAQAHGRVRQSAPRTYAGLDSATRARLQERLTTAEEIEARDLARYLADDAEHTDTRTHHRELVTTAPASQQGGIQ